MTQATGSDVIAACMKEREEAQAAPYTIANAIEDAKWLRRTPDGIIAPHRAKQCIDTLLAALERSRCYFNAVQRGQETFVLVQQDRAAVEPIFLWAQRASEHGCPDTKVEHALATAQRWQGQTDSITKWPD